MHKGGSNLGYLKKRRGAQLQAVSGGRTGRQYFLKNSSVIVRGVRLTQVKWGRRGGLNPRWVGSCQSGWAQSKKSITTMSRPRKLYLLVRMGEVTILKVGSVGNLWEEGSKSTTFS